MSAPDPARTFLEEIMVAKSSELKKKPKTLRNTITDNHAVSGTWYLVQIGRAVTVPLVTFNLSIAKNAVKMFSNVVSFDSVDVGNVLAATSVNRRHQTYRLDYLMP